MFPQHATPLLVVIAATLTWVGRGAHAAELLYANLLEAGWGDVGFAGGCYDEMPGSDGGPLGIDAGDDAGARGDAGEANPRPSDGKQSTTDADAIGDVPESCICHSTRASRSGAAGLASALLVGLLGEKRRRARS